MCAGNISESQPITKKFSLSSWVNSSRTRCDTRRCETLRRPQVSPSESPSWKNESVLSLSLSQFESRLTIFDQAKELEIYDINAFTVSALFKTNGYKKVGTNIVKSFSDEL